MSGAQLHGWTHAWIPHPCAAWHHMDHDWAQGRTHILQPGRPSLLPPPHLRAASGQVDPQVPMKSPDLGILLLPPLPHHPKHHEQSQGRTWESSRKGSSRAPLPVRSLWTCSGCPHAPLGVTHRLCSEPRVSPAGNSAATEGLHWPLSSLSLITNAALGSPSPSQSFRLWDRLLTSCCREAPQRAEQHPKDLYCFCGSPRAPACLCRCDTYRHLSHSVPADSVQTEVGHAPKWGSRFRG